MQQNNVGGSAARTDGAPTTRTATLIALGLMVWTWLGVLPVAVVECDGVRVSVAADMARTISRAQLDYTYLWDGLSGSYALLMALLNVVPLDNFTLYALLSALGATVFVLLGARIATELTWLPTSWAVCATLLLFQEAMALHFFPNTNALAAPVFAMAWLVALHARGHAGLALAGLIFGLSAWLRADIALMAPAIAFAAVRGDGLRKDVTRVLVIGATTAVVLAICMGLSDADPRRLLQTVAAVEGGHIAHTPGAGLSRMGWVRSDVAFFSVASIPLMLLGLTRQLIERQWLRILRIVAGAGPVILFYFPGPETPKELAYALPFLTALALEGVDWLLAERTVLRRVLVGVIGLAFTIQALIGVQITLATKPWGGPTEAMPVTLYSKDFKEKTLSRIAVGLGSGTEIPTSDGPRLASGTLLLPAFWAMRKRQLKGAELALRHRIEQTRADLTLFSMVPNATQLGTRVLDSAGFVMQRTDAIPGTAGRSWRYMRGDRTITAVQSNKVRYEPEDFGIFAGPGVFIVGTGRQQKLVADGLGGARPIIETTGFIRFAIFEADLTRSPSK